MIGIDQDVHIQAIGGRPLLSRSQTEVEMGLRESLNEVQVSGDTEPQDISSGLQKIAGVMGESFESELEDANQGLGMC